jgi:hypothetical protein
MSTESRRPPPFYCPACGKKHRADLSALQQDSGAVAKVPCSRCEIIMSLRMGDDGLPKCEMNEVLGGIMSQADVKKSGLLSPIVIPILAAAVVAAVVSFAVGAATASDAGPSGGADPRVSTLEQAVETLRMELGALRAASAKQGRAGEAAGTEASRQRDDNSKTLGGLGTTMTALEGQQAQLSTTFLTLQAANKDLKGSIESNYVKLRNVDKRLKTLEGR